MVANNTSVMGIMFLIKVIKSDNNKNIQQSH